jgi:hypothetical protein
MAKRRKIYIRRDQGDRRTDKTSDLHSMTNCTVSAKVLSADDVAEIESGMMRTRIY